MDHFWSGVAKSVASSYQPQTNLRKLIWSDGYEGRNAGLYYCRSTVSQSSQFKKREYGRNDEDLRKAPCVMKFVGDTYVGRNKVWTSDVIRDEF